MRLTLKVEYLKGSGVFVAHCKELKNSAKASTPDQAVMALMSNTENSSLILKRGEKERLGLTIPGLVSEDDVHLQKVLKGRQQKAAFKLRALGYLRRALAGETCEAIGRTQGTSKANIAKSINLFWSKARRYMEMGGTITDAQRKLYTLDDLKGYHNKAEILATLNHFERTIKIQIENPLDFLRKAVMGHSYEQIALFQGVRKAVVAKSVRGTWARALAYVKTSGKMPQIFGMDKIEDVRAGSLIALQVINIYEQYVQQALLK